MSSQVAGLRNPIHAGRPAGARSTADSNVRAGTVDAVVARIGHRAGDGGRASLVARVEVEGITPRVGIQRDVAIGQGIPIVVLVLVVAVQVVQSTRAETTRHIAREDFFATLNGVVPLLGVHVQRGGVGGIGTDPYTDMPDIHRKAGLVRPQRDAVTLLRIARTTAATTTRSDQCRHRKSQSQT